MSRIFVLGAGPAGLGAALSAKEIGSFQEIIVIDRQKSVGGLAQTLRWGSVGKHDLGPHKLFSLDRDLVMRVKSFLPSEMWLTRSKVARVFQNGTVMSYPPSVVDMAKYFHVKLPWVVFQFFLVKIKFWKKSSNLQEAIRNKVGKSLADHIILPAITKVWGDPTELDSGLAESRVQIPTVLEIVKGIFKVDKDSKFQAHEFDYPKGGLSVLWDAIQLKLQGFGVTFYLGSSIKDITVVNSKLSALSLSTGQSFNLEPGDLVISTLNLDVFLKLIEETKNEARTTMDLVLVFAHVSGKLNKISWLFVPDRNLLTHRVSSQSAFDPDMVPNGDIICLEYMDRNSDINDQNILETARTELLNIYGSEVQILDIKSIRLADSYPKFTAFDLDSNNRKLEKVQSIENLLSIGRHGAAQYVGSLDAFDMGLKTSYWIENPTTEGVRSYRAITLNYPILD